MAKAHIFIANADPDILDLLRDVLEDEGHSVSAPIFQGSAYDEITERVPDLVMLDIMFHDLGTDKSLIAKLRQNPNTSNIPVIGFSAAIKELRESQDILERMDCLVVEIPFDIDHMLAVVAQALRSRGPNST